jgi:2,5-diketo-D-gluconate reductase A
VQIPTDTLPLPGGGAFPIIGFGTWQLRGEECYAATLAALEAGYRHVDTATMYRNETEVGRALRDSGVPREEVFVTTKYNPRSGRPELAVLAESLDAMSVSYVDLWLVHSPDDSRNEAIWKSFGSAQEDGRARDIGVSNFSVRQIDRVSSVSGVTPAVNQIEWPPSLYDG